MLAFNVLQHSHLLDSNLVEFSKSMLLNFNPIEFDRFKEGVSKLIGTPS